MPWDDVKSEALWNAYECDDSPANEAALAEFYAPRVLIEASMLKRGNPGFYSAPIEDLVSDGCLGLLWYIRKKKAVQNPRARSFFLVKRIRRIIAREASLRRRKRAGLRYGVLAEIRQQFVIERGRVPSRGELERKLSDLLTNPLIQFGDAGDFAYSDTPAATHTPDRNAMDDETINMAMGLFEGEDLRMFKLVFDGTSVAEIGRIFGISESHAGTRVNGLCWQARCNEALATQLGVEAHEGPVPRRPSNRLPPSIRNMPPARLAAG